MQTLFSSITDVGFRFAMILKVKLRFGIFVCSCLPKRSILVLSDECMSANVIRLEINIVPPRCAKKMNDLFGIAIEKRRTSY